MKKEKEKSVVISKVSVGTYITFTKRLNLSTLVDAPPQPQSDRVFVPFTWTANESASTSAATMHLQTQLSNFGVVFGDKNYKLVDTHSKNDLLNCEDAKFGKVSGGTDVIIVPANLNEISHRDGICALFELKTTTTLSKELDRLQCQTLLELICARLHSNQPHIIAVLTDLNSAAFLYTIGKDETSGNYILWKHTLTLAQMAEYVSEFLPVKCHRLAQDCALTENRVDDLEAVGFKRKYTTSFSTLAWEGYEEEVDETKPWSQERNDLISDVMRSIGVEKMPTILSLPSHIYT